MKSLGLFASPASIYYSALRLVSGQKMFGGLGEEKTSLLLGDRDSKTHSIDITFSRGRITCWLGQISLKQILLAALLLPKLTMASNTW